MTTKDMVKGLCKSWFRRPEQEIARYMRQGRRPWSRGYCAFKERFIVERLRDGDFLRTLQATQALPARYGEFLDERVVEYPWLFAHLAPSPGRLLDAGSILNQAYLLDQPSLRAKEITIVTLAPEEQCYWNRKVSYLFNDLRDLPLRDDWFDEVVSISTLEHVGKDNTLIYTPDRRYHENDAAGYLQAVRELRRVCKEGGKVYITVPFGRPTDFGWYQQFDRHGVEQLIETFAPSSYRESYYCYENGGWHLSDREASAEFDGFDIHQTKYLNAQSTRDYDPDFAAASRAVVALVLQKGVVT